MQPESIYHICEAPYAFPLSLLELKVRIRTKKMDCQQVTVLYSDRYVAPGSEHPLRMARVMQTEWHDYYEAILPAARKRLRYQFLLEGTNGERMWVGESGPSWERRDTDSFQYPYITESDLHPVPEWAASAVAYQIFVERFANGDSSLNPPDTLDWDTPAQVKADSFYGGDLQGILDKLPYLSDLGINLLYLTPLFRSPSNHKYDTDDYYEIDPHFGDEEKLRELVDQAHLRGIRVMLDAVFNHAGAGWFAFQDVLQRGAASPYKDWFYLENGVDSEGSASNPVYETFAIDIPSMPKLNVDHPEVRRYLEEAALYWTTRMGLDGWRLDVANEVPRGFWRHFRAAVKQVNPDVLLIGEVMHDPQPWLRGDQFDGTMNYPLRDTILAFVADQRISASTFWQRMTGVYMRLSDSAAACMLNLIGSHDTKRFLTACMEGGRGWGPGMHARERMKSALFLLFTLPGIPMIYYGDEVGMTGGTDPDCRKPMEWNPANQDDAMRSFIRRLIGIRRESTALCQGRLMPWFTDDARGMLGFVRETDGEKLVVLLHTSPLEVQTELLLPEDFRGRALVELLSGEHYASGESLRLCLPPFGCALLRWE